MDIPFSLSDGILGHEVKAFEYVQRSAASGRRWSISSRTATVFCTCGAKWEIAWRDLREDLTTWGERMAQAHYVNVIEQALVTGVQFASWPPPESVPQSGALSRDSHPPDHNFEADDEFDFPTPGATIPRRQYPPGTVG